MLSEFPVRKVIITSDKCGMRKQYDRDAIVAGGIAHWRICWMILLPAQAVCGSKRSVSMTDPARNMRSWCACTHSRGGRSPASRSLHFGRQMWHSLRPAKRSQPAVLKKTGPRSVVSPGREEGEAACGDRPAEIRGLSLHPAPSQDTPADHYLLGNGERIAFWQRHPDQPGAIPWPQHVLEFGRQRIGNLEDSFDGALGALTSTFIPAVIGNRYSSGRYARMYDCPPFIWRSSSPGVRTGRKRDAWADHAGAFQPVVQITCRCHSSWTSKRERNAIAYASRAADVGDVPRSCANVLITLAVRSGYAPDWLSP
ncbi:hypothetical protein GGR00_005520 [Aminobacter aganoensis]|uniref:Uncharacterized protein n=1 Tax=Aminobacter aganoensis TaxID=83264 RepID=A0A7X0FDE8_9HYPH|nr:hypothetical protein [Aminobacter aganoensis]